jgi:hypothetical protein
MASAGVNAPSARIVRNERTGALTMAQHGSSDGTSLTRAVAWVCVVFGLCGLVTACVSDVCPGDQIMVDRECIPAGVATEDAQTQRNFRATQVAEDERQSDDATP